MVALLVVALSVGLDNFGAAAAIGISGVDRAARIRVIAVFGVFEGVMPVVGVLVGHSVASTLGGASRYVAGGVLCLAGVYTIASEALQRGTRPLTGGTGGLLILGAVLSIDNLVVGFALGTYHVSLITAALVLGAVSTLLTVAGLELGRRLGGRIARFGESFGGIVLIGVGAAIAAGV